MTKQTHIIERLIPGVNRYFCDGSAILRQHILRYRIAAAYMREEDRILDAGCGSGYGTYILAGSNAKITGVDKDPEIIKYAEITYKHERIKWICSGIEDFKGNSDYFSRIVCFETIEHVEKPELFLKALLNMLKHDGVMICSVPIVPTVHFNQFHLNDFTEESLLKIFQSFNCYVIDKMIQESTYLILVITKTQYPDLESRPIIEDRL